MNIYLSLKIALLRAVTEYQVSSMRLDNERKTHGKFVRHYEREVCNRIASVARLQSMMGKP